MSVYVLVKGVIATQTVANVGGNSNPIVMPPGPSGQFGAPTSSQTFQILVTATSGAASASVQPVGSNDGTTWTPIGSAIAVTSGTAPVNNGATTATSYSQYGAFVTAIAGTGASVQVLMSA